MLAMMVGAIYIESATIYKEQYRIPDHNAQRERITG